MKPSSRCIRSALLVCFTTLTTVIVGCGRSIAPLRPNIVLFLADDLGFEALGAYGGVSYQTPALDRLAASGVRFTYAYSTPLCSPSRVQFMTGRYNQRNYTNWGVLPKDEITFANLLREAGYATFVAGKWQLWGHRLGVETPNPCCWGQGQTPQQAGFDDYLLWFLKGKDSRYADPQVWRKGGRGESVAGAYGPDLFMEFILGAIEEQVEKRPEQPFFIYYPMVLPHTPFVPTPDSDDWATDRDLSDPAYFAGMIAYMDKIVGTIVSRVDELGIRGDTLILFTADNGTSRGIQSSLADGRVIPGAKGHTTGGGTRVPLIVSWPGEIEAGTVSDALIDFSDFLPSLTDVAGASLPRDRVIDGRSFMPLLRGKGSSIRDWIYTDYRPGYRDFPEARYTQDRRFKLYDDGRFFDVENDEFEVHPLDASELEGEAARAKTRLEQVLTSMAG